MRAISWRPLALRRNSVSLTLTSKRADGSYLMLMEAPLSRRFYGLAEAAGAGRGDGARNDAQARACVRQRDCGGDGDGRQLVDPLDDRLELAALGRRSGELHLEDAEAGFRALHEDIRVGKAREQGQVERGEEALE